MKTTLIIAAIALLPMGLAAQNKVACRCAKASHHHVAKHIQKPVLPMAATETPMVVPTVPPANEPPCTMYRSKSNIVVTECPSIMFDQEGYIQTENAQSFSGYYPNNQQNALENKSNEASVEAPQHTTISNEKGVAPANGNACDGQCTPQ